MCVGVEGKGGGKEECVCWSERKGGKEEEEE